MSRNLRERLKNAKQIALLGSNREAKGRRRIVVIANLNQQRAIETSLIRVVARMRDP